MTAPALDILIERRDRLLARLIGMRLFDAEACLDQARTLVWLKAFRPEPSTPTDLATLHDPLPPILEDLAGLSFYDATRVIETVRFACWDSAFPEARYAAPQGAVLN